MRFFNLFLVFALTQPLLAQQPPYDQPLPVEAPYYRVRFEGSTKPGELVYPVSFTIWIPPVESLRGVVVHQHGCGEGSCKSGQTGAFDLHWQALARKHNCALIAAVFEQPEKENCQLWCDPRNGSDHSFQKALAELGKQSAHPELAQVPWALWGHSGGGHWAGGMALLHPEKVVAAWLRSGVPQMVEAEGKPKAYLDVPEAANEVPILCNLGTKEGVTVRDDRFAGVWLNVETYFNHLRPRGALVGIAVDPLTSHECGNQRYLAILWLDACLTARLPDRLGQPLKKMPSETAWLASFSADHPQDSIAVKAADFGDLSKSVWLPDEKIAKAWMQYVRDTAIDDKSPPPAPSDLKVEGNNLSWQAQADLESGLAGFIIERDGKVIARLPEQAKNPFGRPLFQNLQYSDTPSQPLVQMRFTDSSAEPTKQYQYRIKAVNTVGLESN